MIIATVQSYETGSAANSITIINGKKVKQKDAQPYLNQLQKFIRNIAINDEGIREISGVKVLCVQYHPEKDDKDRMRPVLVLWDKSEELEKIEETIRVMGLDIQHFKKLYQQYEIENANSKKRILTAMIGALAIVVIFSVLIYIFKKG